MADKNQETPLTNGTHTPGEPLELSIGLTRSHGMTVHLHLTVLATSIMLFITSVGFEGQRGGAALGSFVYAMPDQYNPTQPLSTALYTTPSSVDFATRLAKVLVRRTGKLCYVGGSINLSDAASGGSLEEEMGAFRAIVDVVTAEAAKTTT